MQEFKVGDRVRLEGVVAREATLRVFCGVRFEGSSVITLVTDEEMAGATLIKPAEPEAPKLDVTNPILHKRSKATIRYVGDMSNGQIAGEYELDGNLYVADYYLHELENIPEPKRTTSRDVLHIESDDGESTFLWGDFAYSLAKDWRVTSRCQIKHTEGEGWSIEEETK